MVRKQRQNNQQTGAPKKSDAEKKDPNTGLTGHQMEWMQRHSGRHDIAVAKINRDSMAQVERLLTVSDAQEVPVYQVLERVIDWYLDSLTMAQANMAAMQAEHEKELSRRYAGQTK